MTAGQENDEWLMGQVRLGNREFLEPLVRRYASQLLTYLHRMSGNRHRAEEILQEVFLTVWLKRHTYKFPKSFKPWLFAIATNKCRSEFRRAAVPLEMARTIEYETTEHASSPADLAVTTETSSLVAAAVARLPIKQRNVVVMRIWNQMSFAEIADALGRSEGTVRSNMHHGLATLRRSLENTFNKD